MAVLEGERFDGWKDTFKIAPLFPWLRGDAATAGHHYA
jgi:hypothetical protein